MHISDYEITLYKHLHDYDDDILIASQSGKEIWKYNAHRIEFERWINAPDALSFPHIGTNVTGGTNSQIIVQSWSGGAHCCNQTHVLDLGSKLTDIIPPSSGDYPQYYIYIKKQNNYRFVTYDNIFSYWHSSFAQSAAPKLIFIYKDNKYELDKEFMKKNSDVYSYSHKTLINDSDWSLFNYDNTPVLPSKLLNYVINLTYSGKIKYAEKIFLESWPANIPGKTDFFNRLFHCRIRMSTYWSDIASMNSVAALPPEGNCPSYDE